MAVSIFCFLILSVCVATYHAYPLQYYYPSYPGYYNNYIPGYINPYATGAATVTVLQPGVPPTGPVSTIPGIPFLENINFDRIIEFFTQLFPFLKPVPPQPAPPSNSGSSSSSSSSQVSVTPPPSGQPPVNPPSPPPSNGGNNNLLYDQTQGIVTNPYYQYHYNPLSYNINPTLNHLYYQYLLSKQQQQQQQTLTKY